MQTQQYRDFTLVFGAPSGDRYEMLCGIADQTERSFSEVYFEYLTEVFKPRNNTNLIDETLSVILNEDVHVGECHMDYQRWLEERQGCSKFTHNCHLHKGDDKFLIKIPFLMLYPERFINPSGKMPSARIEQHHIEHLAAVIGKTIQLDWVQTWFAYADSNSVWDSKGHGYVD